jgi:hypothetical protein
MPTAEQTSWLSNFLGIDVGAMLGAVETIVQSKPGDAMLPDCKPVKGKVPGPAQHLLCATHGHVLDIKEKKIIAISLEQYKSQKMGSAGDTGGSGRQASPSEHAKRDDLSMHLPDEHLPKESDSRGSRAARGPAPPAKGKTKTISFGPDEGEVMVAQFDPSLVR